MIKKKGVKKVIIITLSVVLLALAVPFAVMYHNYTKEICVMEPVEHMEQREGVSMEDILVEMEYSTITNGEEIQNYLYVFKNGDVYSGYNINYRYIGDNDNQEQWERERYLKCMDDRYWDYLYEQCYWGRLSSCNLNGIINELAQIDFVHSRGPIDVWDEPNMGTQKGIQTGTQTEIQVRIQMETQEEQIDDQENKDLYGGHGYRGWVESDGMEGLEGISWGTAEKVTMYHYSEHAHNAIDIIKSTWAYEQWTNQIFGEGWEERIDLKDELEEDRL